MRTSDLNLICNMQQYNKIHQNADDIAQIESYFINKSKQVHSLYVRRHPPA